MLYAGLRAGLALPYECATGTCGTCKAAVTAGDTAYLWPDAPGRKYAKAPRNEVLTCQSVALSDVSLELFKFADPTSLRFAPQYLRGTIARSKLLAPDIMAVDVRLEEPFSFEAGQFVVFEVDAVEGGRAYSMVNFEPQTRDLEFVIKRLPGGAFTEWLFSHSREGAPVRMFGPLGRATFHPSSAGHVVCIAGMMSILAHGARERHFSQRDARVFFGVRTAGDAFYFEKLRALACDFPGRVRVTIGLSHEEPSAALRASYPEFEFDTGFIHEVAKRALGSSPADTTVYVAGPPPMVEAALRMLLLELKHSGSDIRYDKFS